MQLKINKGMSLIEILVVVGVFSVLGVLTTRAIVLTLSGSKKTENLIRIRENLNFSLGIVARNLRNADDITSVCNNTPLAQLNYIDQYGGATSFSCLNVSGVGYIASGSAQVALTSPEINVTNCSFTCQTAVSGEPDIIKISATAKDTTATGTADSTVTVNTSVSLRNY